LTDNRKIKLGDSDDLQIYHDGSFNRFKAANFIFNNAAGNQSIIEAYQGGAVQLYHNNSKKFETTSTGIETHGNITTHDLLPDTNAYRNIGTSTNKWNNVHATTLYGDGSNLTGINTDLVSDTSPQLGGDLDTNSHHILIDDDHEIRWGNDSDIRVFHANGNANFIQSYNNVDFRIHTFGTTAKLRLQVNESENSVVCIPNGATELYHNGNKKAFTGSTGFNVNGNCDLVNDNNKLQVGNDADLQIYHDGTHSYIARPSVADGQLLIRAVENENSIVMSTNGAVELYYDNSKEVETTSYGISVNNGTSAGSISAGVGIELKGATTSEIRLKNASGGDAATDGFGIQKWNNGHTYLYEYDNHDIIIGTNNVSRWKINGSDGHFEPITSGNYDIGSSSKRVRNIYTNDLHLSNEGSSNDVDGSWGDWTIQEGESNLFLKNNRSGKKYKFNLTEVS